uniref:NADH-ubiquinone oxidoreductase chain 2 n=1 Tax=Tachyta nana TaxID=931308 RepID=A0A343A3X5_9CARA|nr:NADH dehydrogenase subunit 2 [Tachyta nana]AOY39253.1 NADH dehydrogenase subunit 2 [Tachyta nana]
MFILTLILGTLISISSYSWLGTWMGLEMNLLSFIPLIKENNNSFSSESSIKYFLIQALASSMFLISIIILMTMSNLLNEFFINNFMLSMIMNSSLLMKMGAAPFHFWFPEIIEGLNWMNSLILMTWQKIAPMMLLSYSIKFNNFIIIIILMSTLIGSISGLNQISMRKLMAYSSINHLGWMLSSFLFNEMLWINYFILYFYMLISLIYILNKFKIFYMKQMFLILNKNTMIKFIFSLNFLSLGGLPPFLGFMPKWLIIQHLSMNYMFLLLFMILMSLITLFFYMRIIYSSLIFMNNQLIFNSLITIKINSIILIMSFFSINGLIIITMLNNYL